MVFKSSGLISEVAVRWVKYCQGHQIVRILPGQHSCLPPTLCPSNVKLVCEHISYATRVLREKNWGAERRKLDGQKIVLWGHHTKEVFAAAWYSGNTKTISPVLTESAYITMFMSITVYPRNFLPHQTFTQFPVFSIKTLSVPCRTFGQNTSDMSGVFLVFGFHWYYTI